MPKMTVDDWSTTAVSNTDVGGISIVGSALNSNVDDALRQIMKQIADWRDGMVPIINVEGYGITAGNDVTALAKALYADLENAIVMWPPGNFDLTDYILVPGDNVTTIGSGRGATVFRQQTWGLPCFATADPEDEAVRPNNVRFYDCGFEAWNDGVKCYFHHAFYTSGTASSFDCNRSSTSTSANVYLFRDGVYEEPASVVLGSGIVTVNLSTPKGADEHILIKVTNKEDLYGDPSIWLGGVAQRNSDSAAVFHGGGDGFVFERCHVEGFVCIATIIGDWTSNDDGRQSANARVYDVTFNNTDFLLMSEVEDYFVDQITGGLVSETQTDTGLTYGVAPTYKDPHVLYLTDAGTLAVTRRGYVGQLVGTNRYSSNYKFRNNSGLLVLAGSADNFMRHLDIEACENSQLSFNTLGGAFDGHYDPLRAVFTLYGCQGVTVDVERLYLTSLVTRIARFRYGRVFGTGGDNGECSQCVVRIKDLFLNASGPRAASTVDWSTNDGGVDCWLVVDRLHILGDMGGHIFRARESGLDGSAASRGGLIIKQIVAVAENPDIRIARLIAGSGSHPQNMRIEVGKQMSIGGVWDGDEFSDSGTGNRFLIDGQERIALTAVTCSFATPGDATFTPTLLNQWAMRHGDKVEFSISFNLETSAFTTASGSFQIEIAGLPEAATDMVNWPLNVTDARGIDLQSSTRQLGARLTAATGIITIRENVDDGAGNTITTAAFDPAGASDYVFAINGSYKAA